MKLTAQELRIGNYIASSGNPTNQETWVVGKVHSISSLDSNFEQLEIETEEDMTWFFKDNYFGIPLTEQWLIDFGFEKCIGWDDQVFHQKDRVDIFEWLSGYEYDDFNIKTVHQLQNLYFALTGKELTLNK